MLFLVTIDFITYHQGVGGYETSALFALLNQRLLISFNILIYNVLFLDPIDSYYE